MFIGKVWLRIPVFGKAKIMIWRVMNIFRFLACTIWFDCTFWMLDLWSTCSPCLFYCAGGCEFTTAPSLNCNSREVWNWAWSTIYPWTLPHQFASGLTSSLYLSRMGALQAVKLFKTCLYLLHAWLNQIIMASIASSELRVFLAESGSEIFKEYKIWTRIGDGNRYHDIHHH